jgi:hypothetical protein
MVSRTGKSLYAPARLAAAIIGLIALGNCPVFGQGSTGSITGTVKDMSGAVLQGTAVTVKHLETGLTRAAEADATGSYNISSLPIGAYEVTAEKMGFQREVRRGIDLVVGQEAEINLILRVGNINQQVTVTEELPMSPKTPIRPRLRCARSRRVAGAAASSRLIRPRLCRKEPYISPLRRPSW